MRETSFCKTPECFGRAGLVTGFCQSCVQKMRRRVRLLEPERGAPMGGRPALSEEQLAFIWRKRAQLWSSRRIARELGISVATVEKYVRRGRGS